MKYKVVLIDADGMTLRSRRFSDEIQQDYGISWDKMQPFFAGPFQRCKTGQADLKEELSRVIVDWGWKGTVDELVTYWFSVGCDLNPDVISVAQELRLVGVRCCLATNQEKYRAEYLCQVVGLDRIFDELFVSAELGYTKDDVRHFQAVHERLAVSVDVTQKEHILFVDHEEKNLLAAKTFGYAVHKYHDVDQFRTAVFASR